MVKTKNILFCGVGGQGLMLSSTIIANALFEAGFDVKKSEIHGMSQRGGSIISFIRYGEKVYSPIFDNNECDIMVSFEKIEAMRNASYLYSESLIIFNNYSLSPTTIYFTDTEYPEDTIIQNTLNKRTKNIKIIEAHREALQMGNEKITNIILTGYLSHYLPVKKKIWLDMLKKFIKPKMLDINFRAFEIGGNL